MTLNDFWNKMSYGNYKLYISDEYPNDEIFEINNISDKTGAEVFEKIGSLPHFVLHQTLYSLKLSTFINEKYSNAEIETIYFVKDGLIIILNINSEW